MRFAAHAPEKSESIRGSEDVALLLVGGTKTAIDRAALDSAVDKYPYGEAVDANQGELSVNLCSIH